MTKIRIKKSKAVLILIESTGATVKHTFKFDNDDLSQNIGPGTQVITCIEFKNGKGEPSCLTDSLQIGITTNQDNNESRLYKRRLTFFYFLSMYN